MIAQPAIFPSDNPLDIPMLRDDLQGVPVVPPVVCWGSIGRSKRMQGTFVFYAYDVRFERALRNPEQLSQTGCHAAAEPNVSVYDDTPMAAAIWATYRKRWAARSWQELGVRVLVDLNVPERYLSLNLTGVPLGWRAYATRGYKSRPESLEREWSTMREHSQGAGTLLVYGGGDTIQALCRDLPGSVWVPDHVTERKGARASDDGCAVVLQASEAAINMPNREGQSGKVGA